MVWKLRCLELSWFEKGDSFVVYMFDIPMSNFLWYHHYLHPLQKGEWIASDESMP